ncbi:MAG: ankyrin repeat domain-containing protein [Candidatus Babeliaceae bacterium]|jgi:ankyrin repeat protein
MNFYARSTLLLCILGSNILHAGNTHARARNNAADSKKKKSYVRQQPKTVPSLKILAGLATLTYKKPKEYSNSNKIPRDLIAYLTFLNMYKSNYSQGLLFAAKDGKKELIQDFLDLGAPIETGAGLATPFLWAAQEGHLPIVQLLQQNGANIFAINSQKSTALILASIDGYYDVCQYLINQDIHVNAQNKFGHNALMCAASKGHSNICQLLLDKKAHPQVTDNNNRTALQLALEKQKEIRFDEREKQKNYEIITQLLLTAEKQT